MESLTISDEIEIEKAEKKAKEEMFTKLECNMQKMEEYYKEKRESQLFLMPYLKELGKENIKRIIVKNKKGIKLWDYFQA